MGMTIAEKIIAAAAGVDSVKPGDIYTVQLDHLMSNDGTTHLTVDMYNNKLKHPHIADAKKMVFIVDHNVPADSPKTAASQKKMRDFARENNIDFWEGKGVCHQIMMEHYVCPGELIFGADSHTCTYGALGAFGTGVGCTDLLYGMVTGTSWVLVPETVKFNLTGKLPEGEREAFLRWLYDFEYRKLGLPAPDLVLYLDMPTERAVEMLRRREGETHTAGDIHEVDTAYLRRCRQAALTAARLGGWQQVSCVDEAGAVRAPEELHCEIWDRVRSLL